MTVPIYIPTNSVGEFPSLHILSSIYCFKLNWLLKITTKDLDYYINFTDKTVAGFESTDSSFEKSSAVKHYQAELHATGNRLWKEESINAANFSVVLF